jgi:hypothetical protein
MGTGRPKPIVLSLQCLDLLYILSLNRYLYEATYKK